MMMRMQNTRVTIRPRFDSPPFAAMEETSRARGLATGDLSGLYFQCKRYATGVNRIGRVRRAEIAFGAGRRGCSRGNGPGLRRRLRAPRPSLNLRKAG